MWDVVQDTNVLQHPVGKQHSLPQCLQTSHKSVLRNEDYRFELPMNLQNVYHFFEKLQLYSNTLLTTT